MEEHHLFDELLGAAEKLGVEVRIEPFVTPAIAGGGLCLVRGERLVLLDALAARWDRILALARALAELENDAVYMAPEARELVDGMAGDRTPPVERTMPRV